MITSRAYWRFFVIGVIIASLGINCLGGLHLGGAASFRVPRATAPDIRMTSDAHWLIISCLVHVHRPHLKVFITCPSLGKTSMNCYENCIPSRPCTISGTIQKDCVPDRSAVNCTETVKEDGSKITTLRIDKRDQRVEGQWVCSHAGQKSNTVNVGLDIEHTKPVPIKPKTLADTKPKVTPFKEPILADIPISTLTYTPVTSVEEPPVYFAFASFMSKSPWIFCIIAIFIVSVTVNIILWIRWCLLCIFAEQRKTQNDEQKVLGEMLCIPTHRIKKANSGLWENDVFPGSQMGDGFQNPICFDEGSHNFRHFSSVSPAYLLDGLPEGSRFQQFDDNEFAFPQIATMRSDQMGMLYRAKSAVATYSPPIQNARDWSTLRSNRIRSANGTIHAVQPLQPPLDSPIPAPSQYNLSMNKIDFSTLGPLDSIDSVSQRRLPRVNLNSSSGVTLYDDVPSGSMITVLSQSNGDNNNRRMTHPSTLHAPQLPRMAEFSQQENEEELLETDGINERDNNNYKYVGHNLPPPPPDNTSLQETQRLSLSPGTTDAPVYHSLETFGRRKKNNDDENNVDGVFRN